MTAVRVVASAPIDVAVVRAAVELCDDVTVTNVQLEGGGVTVVLEERQLDPEVESRVRELVLDALRDRGGGDIPSRLARLELKLDQVLEALNRPGVGVPRVK